MMLWYNKFHLMKLDGSTKTFWLTSYAHSQGLPASILHPTKIPGKVRGSNAGLVA